MNTQLILQQVDSLIESVQALRALVAEQSSNADSEHQPGALPKHGFIYRDRKIAFSSHEKRSIKVYSGLLRELWNDFPERREVMAAAMRSRGRVCTYVAQKREELYRNKDAAWIRKHSCELVPGWYFDTVLDDPSKEKLLRLAVKAAGLAWGRDVIVAW